LTPIREVPTLISLIGRRVMDRPSSQSFSHNVLGCLTAAFVLTVLVPTSPVAPLPKDDYRRAAQAALEKYHFAEALQNFEQCLKWEPKNAELHLLAAQAARRKGE